LHSKNGEQNRKHGISLTWLDGSGEPYISDFAGQDIEEKLEYLEL
jgi:hypothetical protein